MAEIFLMKLMYWCWDLHRTARNLKHWEQTLHTSRELYFPLTSITNVPVIQKSAVRSLKVLVEHELLSCPSWRQPVSQLPPEQSSELAEPTRQSRAAEPRPGPGHSWASKHQVFFLSRVAGFKCYCHQNKNISKDRFTEIQKKIGQKCGRNSFRQMETLAEVFASQH